MGLATVPQGAILAPAWVGLVRDGLKVLNPSLLAGWRIRVGQIDREQDVVVDLALEDVRLFAGAGDQPQRELQLSRRANRN